MKQIENSRYTVYYNAKLKEYIVEIARVSTEGFRGVIFGVDRYGNVRVREDIMFNEGYNDRVERSFEEVYFEEVKKCNKDGYTQIKGIYLELTKEGTYQKEVILYRRRNNRGNVYNLDYKELPVFGKDYRGYYKSSYACLTDYLDEVEDTQIAVRVLSDINKLSYFIPNRVDKLSGKEVMLLRENHKRRFSVTLHWEQENFLEQIMTGDYNMSRSQIECYFVPIDKLWSKEYEEQRDGTELQIDLSGITEEEAKNARNDYISRNREKWDKIVEDYIQAYISTKKNKHIKNIYF